MHAGSFCVSVIHGTMTWTTGSLTCVRDHSFACVYTHRGWAHRQQVSTTFLTQKNSHKLFFPLQQQKLIELIRDKDIEGALHYAQSHLSERVEENPDVLSELEKTLALLAFENPENSPFGELLHISQRQKVWSPWRLWHGLDWEWCAIIILVCNKVPDSVKI